MNKIISLLLRKEQVSARWRQLIECTAAQKMCFPQNERVAARQWARNGSTTPREERVIGKIAAIDSRTATQERVAAQLVGRLMFPHSRTSGPRLNEEDLDDMQNPLKTT